MSVEYKKIMVTLDGSDFAAQALPHAEGLAKNFGAELILFRVVPDAKNYTEPIEEGYYRVMDERQQHFADDAMNRMDELVNHLKLQHINVQPVVDVGHPASKIVDYAKEHDVDLIVICTHGRTGLARWVYGSVAHRVLQHAPCSVFLIRAEH